MPIFSLHVEASSCRYEICVNGVPVERDYYGRPMSGWITVNHWLSSPKVDLSVRVWPVPEEADFVPDARCRVVLHVRPTGERIDGPANVPVGGSVEFDAIAVGDPPSGHDGDPATGIIAAPPARSAIEEDDQPVKWRGKPFRGGVVVSRSFSFPDLFPRWAWVDGDRIEVSTDTFDRLVQFYARIWDMLESGKPHQILPMFVERNRELAAAYFKAESDFAGKPDFVEAVVDPGRRFRRPGTKHLVLDVFADGRLARLALRDGEAATFFSHNDIRLFDFYEIILRREGGGWVIAR
ncbi:MAG: hypothetical protein HQL40_00510 [Alphaproteobacteria bacterium]|nr:hypothetical protein [Alphaproteobacteria bacterium]